MKQNNFLFVDIVSSLFLLVLLVSNFLGLLYITEGNMVLSFLISMLIIVFYFFIIKALKSNKEMMSKNKYMDKNIILWVFFLILSFGTFALTTHFLNVEFNSKAAIQKDAQTKLDIVNTAFTEYKKRADIDMQDYEGGLKTRLQAYSGNPSRNIDIKNELLEKPFSLPPSSIQYPKYINVNAVADAAVSPLTNVTNTNIAKLDKTLIQGNKKYSDVFENWKRTKLMSSYVELNGHVESSILKINTNIEKLPFQNKPLALQEGNPVLPINKPIELYNKFKPDLLVPSAAVLFTHLFILIPFFTEKVRKYGNSYIDHNVREI